MKINKTCLKVDDIGVSTSKVLLNSKPFSIVKLSFDVKSSNWHCNVYPMMLQNNFLLMLMMLLVDCKLLHWKKPQKKTMMWLKLIIKPCVFNVVFFCFNIYLWQKKKNKKYLKKTDLHVVGGWWWRHKDWRLITLMWAVMEV
jgi:hypothetical protein